VGAKLPDGVASGQAIVVLGVVAPEVDFRAVGRDFRLARVAPRERVAGDGELLGSRASRPMA